MEKITYNANQTKNTLYRVLVWGVALMLATESYGTTLKIRRQTATKLYVGTGLGSAFGGFGLPINVGVRFRVQRRSKVWLGADTGLTIGGAVALPLLASVTYELGAGSREPVRPYIGMSLGPVFGFSSGGRFSRSAVSTVSMGVLLRPGLSIDLSKALDMNVEAPLGSLAGNFFIAPQANVVFHL